MHVMQVICIYTVRVYTLGYTFFLLYKCQYKYLTVRHIHSATVMPNYFLFQRLLAQHTIVDLMTDCDVTGFSYTNNNGQFIGIL